MNKITGINYNGARIQFDMPEKMKITVETRIQFDDNTTEINTVEDTAEDTTSKTRNVAAEKQHARMITKTNCN